MTYQTVRQWNGAFVGGLTVTPDAPIPASGWTLRIRYSPAQIIGVRGGTWQRDGAHVAVIRQRGGGNQGPGGSPVRVFVTVAGSAGPPARCTFDGHACRVTVSSGRGSLRLRRIRGR